MGVTSSSSLLLLSMPLSATLLSLPPTFGRARLAPSFRVLAGRSRSSRCGRPNGDSLLPPSSFSPPLTPTATPLQTSPFLSRFLSVSRHLQPLAWLSRLPRASRHPRPRPLLPPAAPRDSPLLSEAPCRPLTRKSTNSHYQQSSLIPPDPGASPITEPPRSPTHDPHLLRALARIRLQSLRARLLATRARPPLLSADRAHSPWRHRPLSQPLAAYFGATCSPALAHFTLRPP